MKFDDERKTRLSKFFQIAVLGVLSWAVVMLGIYLAQMF